MKFTTKYEIFIKTVIMIISGILQAYCIDVFITPSNLISGGFTGLAILINMITTKFSIEISLSLLLFLLNIPVALLCVRSISKKFVFLSLVQIISTSMALKYLHFQPIFQDKILNLTIGGVIFGMQLTFALKTGGSTGGTDFIALYVSNKINKTIWEYIFAFNVAQIIIFGTMFGWDNAGYSIVFQFVVTKTISLFYNRYHRITLQIITTKGDEIIDEYINEYHHGITKTIGYGGYSKEERQICYSVVSVYEVNDIVAMIERIDPHVIINTFKTENFYGNFFIPEI